MQISTPKLTLSDWNPMMMQSLKIMLSASGLLMIAVVIALGGGGVNFIMSRVSMQGLGYFITQPAILSIYFICLLARYRSGNPRLSAGKEVRNALLSIGLGIVITVMLLGILFAVRSYVPAVHAAEVQPVFNGAAHTTLHPVPFQPVAVQFTQVFPVMFNIFSIATFAVITVVPITGVLIGAVVNCNAPLRRNLGVLSKGIFRNFGTLILLSVFSFFLMALWSWAALQSEILIFTSVFPLIFLSVLSYVIAEQIFMPAKRLNTAPSARRFK